MLLCLACYAEVSELIGSPIKNFVVKSAIVDDLLEQVDRLLRARGAERKNRFTHRTRKPRKDNVGAGEPRKA
jgi:hypothetical protein